MLPEDEKALRRLQRNAKAFDKLSKKIDPTKLKDGQFMKDETDDSSLRSPSSSNVRGSGEK